MVEKKTTTKKAPAKKAAPKKAPAKKAAPVAAKPEVAPKKDQPAGEYFYAVGRRKRATATVKLWVSGGGAVSVNDKAFDAYFKVYELREAVMAPLKAVGLDGKAAVIIRVTGGGPRGQAEAARLGISRSLLKVNADWRATLKQLGFLMRDPREKERKKPGLRKARRAPQWSKR